MDRSLILHREDGAESCPDSAKNRLKRPQIHLTNAETLDGTIDKDSNHPKMDGIFPCLPLNPLHPRADGEAMAAGSRKRFPFSFSNL